MMWYTKRQRGYITLVSVLVLGAVGTAITVSLLLLGLGASRNSFAYQQLYQAQALASACAEEGLGQVWSANSFTGSGALILGPGTCSYAVTSQGGSNRTINASGIVGTVVRRVRVIFSIGGSLLLVSSWQDVP